VKNFDQWTEALLRDINFQSDEENTKVLLRSDECVDDDFEEEG
jgi:hypothetical protein